MDVASKEIFFQDNVLFVEGQEDVGLLQHYFEDKDIKLFGYGVRGYDQFKLAFKLAKDLGIKKACVLIDSLDPLNINKVNKNENTIRDDLKENTEELGDFNEKINLIIDYFSWVSVFSNPRYIT